MRKTMLIIPYEERGWRRAARVSTGSRRHRGEEGRCLLQESRVNKIPVLRKITSRTCRLREWYVKMQTPRPRQSCPRKFSVLVRPHFRIEAASYGLLQRHSSLFYTYSQVPGAPSHTHAPTNRFLTHCPVVLQVLPPTSRRHFCLSQNISSPPRTVSTLAAYDDGGLVLILEFCSR